MLTLDGECTPEDLGTLEFLTTQIYQALKHAVKSRRFEDAQWARDIYYAANEYFRAAYINPHSHLAEKRDTERGVMLEKYILHYILIDDAAVVLSHLIMADKPRFIETKHTEEELLGFLKDKNKTYPEIWGISSEIARAGKFDVILNCLDYVRKHYPKPEIE